MSSYRKPTEKEASKLDAARKKTQEGIEGEKDIFSRVSTTAAKAARDDVKAGLKMRESVPASAREGEAYEQAGYKKGGKVMKKTKKYEDGGEIEFETKQGKNEGSSIDEGVRERAMAAMEKGSSDEPAVPKKTAAKLTPKAEAPTPKAEPKAAPKSSAFKDSPTAFKDSPSAFKGSSASAAAKEEPKERNLPRGQAKTNEGVSSFIKKSMDQIGQEGRDQEAKYKATQASMKESGAGLSPRMKAARASSPSTNMRSGGKVSSASKRADGCAIRGKTRA